MDTISATVFLKAKRDKPLRNRHPWVFSGAIARVEGTPSAGDLVRVVAVNGDVLGIGYFNQSSQIRVRLLAWGDAEFGRNQWQHSIATAIARRATLRFDQQTDAYRLVNAEADGLPGLVVDRYGDYLVMQCLTMGIDTRKQMLAELLAAIVQPKAIIERSDAKVRRKEGLPLTSGVLWGNAPPDEIVVHENGLEFAVNLLDGHKTGLYLDQRDNRQLIGDMSDGKSVLNMFSYTGGFGVFAANGGAQSVVNIDSSVSVLESAESNFHRNGFTGDQHEFIAANAFDYLRHLRETGQKFDTIVLDPPKFVHGQRDLQSASRGYKDLNMLAFQLLNPGGMLATFSCSGLMTLDLYQKIVFSAAVDATVDAKVLKILTQAPDHTMSLTFPESFYLKGFLCSI